MPEQRQTMGSVSQTQSPVQSFPPKGGSSWVQSYKTLPGVPDELLTEEGTVRPAAAAFIARLDEIGETGLSKAWKRGDGLLRENALSYNLTDKNSSFRPWSLDPIPLFFTQSEWQPLAEAAIQRAQLWDAVLKDCYGPRTLLNKGLMPPDLLFAQPGFNRSLPPTRPDENLLSFYAVDIARSHNGSWTVIADRTDTPNGAGFALENRVILSKVFPETSNRLNLIRLANYFQGLQHTLFESAGQAVEDPGVILLSPGPNDSSYFEDAYLARYLGIPVAVGQELTVREDRVF